MGHIFRKFGFVPLCIVCFALFLSMCGCVNQHVQSVERQPLPMLKIPFFPRPYVDTSFTCVIYVHASLKEQRISVWERPDGFAEGFSVDIDPFQTGYPTSTTTHWIMSKESWRVLRDRLNSSEIWGGSSQNPTNIPYLCPVIEFYRHDKDKIRKNKKTVPEFFVTDSTYTDAFSIAALLMKHSVPEMPIYSTQTLSDNIAAGMWIMVDAGSGDVSYCISNGRKRISFLGDIDCLEFSDEVYVGNKEFPADPSN